MIRISATFLILLLVVALAAPGAQGQTCRLNEPGSLLVYPLIDNIDGTTIIKLANLGGSDVWLHGMVITHPPGMPTSFTKTNIAIHLTQHEPFWWNTSVPYDRTDVHGVTTQIPAFADRRGFIYVWAVSNGLTGAELAWNHLVGEALIVTGGSAVQYDPIPHQAITVTGNRRLELDGTEYARPSDTVIFKGFAGNLIPGLTAKWAVCSLDIDMLGSIQPDFDINLNVWNQDEIYQSRHLHLYQFQVYDLNIDLQLDIGSVFTAEWTFVTSSDKPIWSVLIYQVGARSWAVDPWQRDSSRGSTGATVILSP